MGAQDSPPTETLTTSMSPRAMPSRSQLSRVCRAASAIGLRRLPLVATVKKAANPVLAASFAASQECHAAFLRLPIAIYYEQPNWFKPLFAELDRRGTGYRETARAEAHLRAEQHPEQEYALVFNRMSPSAWNRDHGDQIFYTLGFLDHLERRGVRVINGLKAFRTELSKAAQLSLLEELGLRIRRRA